MVRGNKEGQFAWMETKLSEETSTDAAEVSMFGVVFHLKSKDGPRQQEREDAGLI